MFNFSRFERLRKEKGVTQVYIADRIGKKSPIFRDWTVGKSKPSDESLRIVADLLGTTPEYLTGETDEKEKPVTNGDGQMLVNNDPELTELLERVRDDPDLRMLFSITKDATSEDIQKAIKIIQALK